MFNGNRMGMRQKLNVPHETKSLTGDKQTKIKIQKEARCVKSEISKMMPRAVHRKEKKGTGSHPRSKSSDIAYGTLGPRLGT
jgi:hypothetical protein